jgi:hypothetical protein
MKRIIRAAWSVIALLSAGCTSYQVVSLHQIESHPDKFIDKKVRVHFHVAGDSIDVVRRTLSEQHVTRRIAVADSVVGLEITAVRFPLLEGWTFADPKLYDTDPEHPLTVDLTGTREVEVFQTDPVRTVLAIGAVALMVGAIYVAYRAAVEESVDDWLHELSGQRSLSSSPRAEGSGP